MKRIIYLLAFSLITFASCKKVEVEPYYEYEEDSYDPKEEIEGYYQNQTDDYTSGGTLPNISNDSSFLDGTKWVLISFRRNGYLETNVNDTIEFVSQTEYTIYKNGPTANRTYTLVKPTGAPTGTYTLTLNTFFLFGSGVDSYSGLISEDVITFEEIYTDFEGNYYGDNIREATFQKIN
jgi:hypothetical protein